MAGELKKITVHGRNGGRGGAAASCRSGAVVFGKALSRMVNLSPFGICYYMPDEGQLVLAEANAAADTLLGIDHRAIIGKTIEEAFPGWARRRCQALSRHAGGGRPEKRFEIDYDLFGVPRAYAVIAFNSGPMSVTVMFRT